MLEPLSSSIEETPDMIIKVAFAFAQRAALLALRNA